MAHKINDAEDYEPIMVHLDENGIAFKNKVEELVEEGMSEEDAKKMARQPFELELYYEKGWGLFAIESGCADSGYFVSPYSKEEYLD